MLHVQPITRGPSSLLLYLRTHAPINLVVRVIAVKITYPSTLLIFPATHSLTSRFNTCRVYVTYHSNHRTMWVDGWAPIVYAQNHAQCHARKLFMDFRSTYRGFVASLSVASHLSAKFAPKRSALKALATAPRTITGAHLQE